MNDLRTAAQQALEAMDREIDTRRCKASTLRAMIALRAALAQQAEPVEQMPVGWLESPHGAFRADPLYKMQFPSQLLHWQIALYTAPPQRKPLTEEEIRDLWSWSMTAEAERTATTQQHAFTRAVERAHGIKE